MQFSLKKRILHVLFLLLCLTDLFAKKSQICEVKYNIEGCGWQIFGKTKPYAVELNVPVDKNTVFESEEDLQSYIKNYEQRLLNTRAFETIEINTDITELKGDIEQIKLTVNLKDTFHLLALPYPKYDSNTGLNLKLKAKDTNFLGTLNTLSTDIYVLLASSESDNKENQIGFNFNFDYPFPIKKLNASWTNSDQFYYVFGQSMPEWNFKSGLNLTLPGTQYTFEWLFNQFFINNLDYKCYDDNLYFGEELEFLSSIKLHKLNNETYIYYTPYVDLLYYWDKNGINNENLDLYGLASTLGHSISNSLINWNNNFRKGYSLTLSNSYSFNIHQLSFTPSVSLTGLYFNNVKISNLEKNGWTFFNLLGFNLRAYTFYNFYKASNTFAASTGTNIGSYLRGFRDEQYYSDSSLGYLGKTNGAILLNMDFPLQILHTNFSRNLFNFDLQFSPFVDLALIQNKYYKTNFNLKNGFYCAGIEVLVYPAKLKSMTIRGSCGFDLRRILKTDNQDYNENISPWEITFGVGLFY